VPKSTRREGNVVVVICSIIFLFNFKTFTEVSRFVSKIALILVLAGFHLYGQEKTATHLAGVYKGKTLFIQNPYNPKLKTFCVSSIAINGQALNVPYDRTAIKIDFNNLDEYTPVSIEIKHDSLCKPIIINPDAIQFYSTFSFESISFDDSVMTWSAHGEHEGSYYLVEKYDLGIWREVDTVQATGSFGEDTYQHYLKVEEGANKYRIKYVKANGEYLYSRELDFHYYPEPVIFRPAQTATMLTLSRTANYDIYDAGGTLVLSGQGNTIDVSKLPSGDYVIYFDKKDPGVFKRQ